MALVDIDARIASALAAERQAVIPALRAAVDELLEQEREHVKLQMTEQMRSLELRLRNWNPHCPRCKWRSSPSAGRPSTCRTRCA
jgi:hypothetical protein